MSLRTLRQYLELLEMSGIEEIFVDSNKKIEPESTAPPKTTKIDKPSKGDLLRKLENKYKDCQKCPLWKGRNKFVYGEGSPDSKLMIIGEGQGGEENKTGKPFVGKAGQLLTKILKAINIARKDVYITNIIKCRPPGNRNPKPEEKKKCLGYLFEQIEIIQPQVFLLLGRVSATTLFNKTLALKKFRTMELNFQGKRTFVTYHPAALLRNPHWKKYAWEDLKKLRDYYEQK